MGRMKESPRYNVLSVRVSDEQIEFIEDLRRQRKSSVSELIREALTTLELLCNQKGADGIAKSA